MAHISLFPGWWHGDFNAIVYGTALVYRALERNWFVEAALETLPLSDTCQVLKPYDWRPPMSDTAPSETDLETLPFSEDQYFFLPSYPIVVVDTKQDFDAGTHADTEATEGGLLVVQEGKSDGTWTSPEYNISGAATPLYVKLSLSGNVSVTCYFSSDGGQTWTSGSISNGSQVPGMSSSTPMLNARIKFIVQLSEASAYVDWIKVDRTST